MSARTLGQKIKCPKCNGTKFMLDELILIVETREVNGGTMTEVLAAEPVSCMGYTAECSNCGHQWKPRRDTMDKFRVGMATSDTGSTP